MHYFIAISLSTSIKSVKSDKMFWKLAAYLFVGWITPKLMNDLTQNYAPWWAIALYNLKTLGRANTSATINEPVQWGFWRPWLFISVNLVYIFLVWYLLFIPVVISNLLLCAYVQSLCTFVLLSVLQVCVVLFKPSGLLSLFMWCWYEMSIIRQYIHFSINLILSSISALITSTTSCVKHMEFKRMTKHLWMSSCHIW